MDRILFALVLLLALPASAACPVEFGGPEYDATGGKVRWCHDGNDVAGAPMPPGTLARCEWTFAWTGSAPVTVVEQSPTPGTVYSFSVTGASGLGSVRGRCFNSYGQAGPEEGPVVARFPVGIPGRPFLAEVP